MRTLASYLHPGSDCPGVKSSRHRERLKRDKTDKHLHTDETSITQFIYTALSLRYNYMKKLVPGCREEVTRFPRG